MRHLRRITIACLVILPLNMIVVAIRVMLMMMVMMMVMVIEAKGKEGGKAGVAINEKT